MITGAGSGLGRALTQQFANANTHLVLLDISESGLKDTEQTLDCSVAQIDSYVVDIGDTPSLIICFRTDIDNDRTRRLAHQLCGNNDY